MLIRRLTHLYLLQQDLLPRRKLERFVAVRRLYVVAIDKV